MSEQALATANTADLTPIPRMPERMMVDPFLATIERFVCDPTVDANKLAILLDQQFRYEDRKSQRKFDEALALAKAKLPKIIKKKSVGYDSKRTGDRTSYNYEDLADIIEQITPVLAEFGISARWRVKSTDIEAPGENGAVNFFTRVTCSCLLSGHGHREESPELSAMADKSGSKNSVQAVGSTQTYLQRYSLKAMVGLAAAEDDDGRGGVNPNAQKVSAEQVAEIVRLLKELKDGEPEETANRLEPEFLKHVGFGSIADITAEKYNDASGVLKRRLAKKIQRAVEAKKQAKAA